MIPGKLLKQVRKISLAGLLVLLMFSSPSLAGNSPAGVSSLDRGLDLFRSEQYQSALPLFSQVVADDPTNGEALYYLGVTQLRLGKPADAILSLEEAAVLEPDIKSLHFNLGLAYYKLDVYSSAVSEFNLAIQQDSENGVLYFFKGLAEQAQNRYRQSIASFNQAQQRYPEYRQLSNFYIGLAHYKGGNISDAKEAFNSTINVDPNSETAKSAREFLDILQVEAESAKPWWVKLGTGYQFDDNLTSQPQDVVAGLEDHAVFFELNTGYRFFERGPYNAEVSYDLYQSIYEDANQFDSQSHTVGLSGNREFKNWDAGIDYSFNRNLLGGQDFLDMNRFSPRVGLSFWDNMYTAISYAYTLKDFLQGTNDGRDAHNHNIGFDHYYFLLGGQAYLSAGYHIIEENTTSDQFDYFGQQFTGAAKTPLFLGIDFRAHYQYFQKDYKHLSPSVGAERFDSRHTVNLTWTRDLLFGIEGKVRYQYINSSSNYVSVDFEENIVSVGISYEF